ncbi:MAG: transposase [Candidatus Wildermuthbacteria bacterium]|nr:transposase [Candidatus Wildermuthbacteria bacterium]
MPRANRQFEIGGVYHVMNRGVEKRDIFLKPQDYSRFTIALEFFNRSSTIDLWPLIAHGVGETAVGGTVPPTRIWKRLEDERKKSRDVLVELLAFSLMPNHFHLIVKEIVDGGVSLFMRKMGGYAGYFNKQYKRIGPLFQSRYKVVRIQTDEQLSAVFHYVHANPIEIFHPGWKEHECIDPSKLLRVLEEYQWSSYQDYFTTPNFPSAIKKDFFLEFFGNQNACKKAFQDWVISKARLEAVPEL